MKKLAQMAKRDGSKGATSAVKGITISKKRQRDETPDILSTKKDKNAIDVKEKGTMPPLKDKKKGPKTPARSKATSSKMASKGVTLVVALGEGTSVDPGVILGLTTSML